MRIVIPGVPIAKARPRFLVRGKHAIAYDSQDKLKYNARSELFYQLTQWLNANESQRSDFKESFNGPKILTLSYYIPIAISDSKAQKNAKLWGWRYAKGIPCKTDLDNRIKWTSDIANGILWHDDSQIVELHAYQHYSENPCTILTVEDIKIIMNDDANRLTRIFSPTALIKLESDLHVLACALESVRLCHGEDRTKHQESAGALLKVFANDYAHALKKIAAK